MEITTFVWKIASRCNLNCSYCYVYRGPDQGWRVQPAFMTHTVARRAAEVIRRYAETRLLLQISINFHGGEPLLGGAGHLEMLTGVIREVFEGSPVRVVTSMQTNGLLFSTEIGDVLLREGVSVYVSLDGPPRVNDLVRLDHKGLPSGRQVEEKLRLLTSLPYRSIFGGFLTVINPISSPQDVMEYLMAFEPPLIDLLLPLANHNTPRASDEPAFAPWLCHSFDIWFSSEGRTRIRMFDRILNRLLGKRQRNNADGALIVETNGALEADDTLKSSYPGASHLGASVFDDELETLAKHPHLVLLQEGPVGLPLECRSCAVVTACEGGHISHRYSRERGFDNVSVHCRDLYALMVHIQTQLAEALHGLRRGGDHTIETSAVETIL